MVFAAKGIVLVYCFCLLFIGKVEKTNSNSFIINCFSPYSSQKFPNNLQFFKMYLDVSMSKHNNHNVITAKYCFDNKIISFMECTINFESCHELRNKEYYVNASCSINDLHTMAEYKGMGFGSDLLKFIKQYCADTNIKTITLDDCTDNYRKTNNIYLKNGFLYDTDTGCEMHLNIV